MRRVAPDALRHQCVARQLSPVFASPSNGHLQEKWVVMWRIESTRISLTRSAISGRTASWVSSWHQTSAAHFPSQPCSPNSARSRRLNSTIHRRQMIEPADCRRELSAACLWRRYTRRPSGHCSHPWSNFPSTTSLSFLRAGRPARKFRETARPFLIFCSFVAVFGRNLAPLASSPSPYSHASLCSAGCATPLPAFRLLHVAVQIRPYLHPLPRGHALRAARPYSPKGWSLHVPDT